MKPWQKLLIGIVLGIIAGLILDEKAQYLEPIGRVFISLIKMIIVPLIFSSITSAITSMGDMKSMGRISIKSFGIYIVTTIFASVTGIIFANLSNLGKGNTLDLDKIAQSTAKSERIIAATENFSILDTLINMIPTNPAASLANASALQIIVFAIFLGIAINLTGEKGRPLANAIDSLAEVMYSLTNIVMKFAPYGVFGLVGWLIGTQDASLLKDMLKLIVVGYTVYVVHIILVYGGMLLFGGRVSPLTFFRKMVPVQLLAYTTSSSAATLPVTIRTAKEDLGVSKSTANFVLPMGTTINMDGTSITIGLYTIFLAGIFGVDLQFGDYVTIILLATLVSIGTAGIPSGSLVMLSMVLISVGVPVEGVAIVAAIDRILDMARTVVNVTGDTTVSIVVDRSEGKFNSKAFSNGKKK